MTTPHLPFPARNDVQTNGETRPGFRTKTVATRLTPSELSEIEAAADNVGQSLAEWLRETALRVARQESAGPIELLLAELCAVRYTLLNLFYSDAAAASEGSRLRSDEVLKIRDQSEATKHQQARRIMDNFFAAKKTEHRAK